MPPDAGAFTESVVEEAALAWIGTLGYSVKPGGEIAPDAPAPERTEFDQVVLSQRLKDALARLNPALPAAALEDAYRKLTRPVGANPAAANRALHLMLVNGVTVEYRRPDGGIAGAQGHDPVAYFTENKAVKGEVSFSHQWKGAIWLFSSAKNRALFVASPDRYAPQYGGYCALSVAYGKTAHGSAEAWSMRKASST